MSPLILMVREVTSVDNVTCATCHYFKACPLAGLRVCRHYLDYDIPIAIMVINGKAFVKPIV